MKCRKVIYTRMFTYYIEQLCQRRYEKLKILFDSFIFNYAYRCSNLNASCTTLG